MLCLPGHNITTAQGAPSRGGHVPPLVLASYAKFSFAEAEGRVAAIQAINAVAVAAAHCMPAVPFAGALSSSPGVGRIASLAITQTCTSSHHKSCGRPHNNPAIQFRDLSLSRVLNAARVSKISESFFD